MIAPDGLPAAGYVRVSTLLQKDNYSPEVQREAILKMAADRGFYIPADQWYSDVERGRHTIKREGYTKMLDACRKGEVFAVFVFTTSRWGRRAHESMERLEELRRRRIRFFSVQQGEQQPGVVFGINALMDEEYVRNLAKTIRPANLRAVKEGKHHGPIPFGYKRIWQPPLTDGGRPRPEMVPDEETAWIIRELFERYDQGESTIDLTRWMNSDPRIPPAPRGGVWLRHVVGQILRNTTYIGEVNYGLRQTGYYDQTPEEERYRGPGRQTPLVDRELFERVQVRLRERGASHVRRRIRRTSAQGVGVLRCPRCGGPMSLDRGKGPALTLYRCSNANRGTTTCSGFSILRWVADAALLAQVKRLQGRPWNVHALDGVLTTARTKDPRESLQRALEAAQRELKNHYRNFNLIDEPTAEEQQAFRDTSREISGRIAAIKAELAAVPESTVKALDLKRFHEQVLSTDIPTLVDKLAENGDEVDLRELIGLLVESATIVERVPPKRGKWARAAVTWAPNVQALLSAKPPLLALGPDVMAPDYGSTKQGKHALHNQRYRERKRAGLVGRPPGQ
ncbi:MAG TPA: recombinase family protein [Chloroflexota bacterium]|nr:recombinase family protein [Chloroflexota bacterium]